jgi:hypothetical protein
MNAFLQIKHYVVVIGLQQPNPVETTNLNVMQIYLFLNLWNHIGNAIYKNWTAIAKTIIAIMAVTTRNPSSPRYLNTVDEYFMLMKDTKTSNIPTNTKEVAKRFCAYVII